MSEISRRGVAGARRGRRPVAAMSLALVITFLGLQGCSSGTPAVCDDVKALKSSVASLKDLKVGGDVLSTLSSDLQKIDADLKQLKSDAKSEFGPDVDKVTSAAEQLRTSLQAATAAPSAATIGAVATAVQALVSSLQSLNSAVSAKKC